MSIIHVGYRYLKKQCTANLSYIADIACYGLRAGADDITIVFTLQNSNFVAEITSYLPGRNHIPPHFNEFSH